MEEVQQEQEEEEEEEEEGRGEGKGFRPSCFPPDDNVEIDVISLVSMMMRGRLCSLSDSLV